MIETVDHDQGTAPLYCGPVGHLARVLLDGHRWATIPPGDPIAEHLVAAGGHVVEPSHDPG